MSEAEEKRPSVAGPEGDFEPVPDGLAHELPENPSVGELVQEIDRARHEAARTAGALVDKLNVVSRIEHVTQDRVGALPPWLTEPAGRIGRTLRENPKPVLATVVALLVLRAIIRRIRHRRATS